MNQPFSDLIPDEAGTYVLVMSLADTQSLTVGRLGRVTLAAGVYLYVGSAQGPGGLQARVRRHLRADKTPHWHIDTLTTAAPVRAVWWEASEERLECVWSQALAGLAESDEPVPGFGASDCRCSTHLYNLPGKIIPCARDVLGEPIKTQV